MNSEVIKVLLIEENPGDTRWVYECLTEVTVPHFELSVVKELAEAPPRLAHEYFDIILLDLELPDGHGLDTLLYLQEQAPHIPIIVLAATDDDAFIQKTLQAGAQDCLTKEDTGSRLLARTVRYAIERKRVENDLRKSESYFRTVIDKNADSMVVVDRYGIVRFVNPAAEALFGYTSAELVGELFGFPIVAGESTELNIVTRRKKPVVTEMRVVAIEWSGQPAFLASLRDITERKWAELERSKLILELEETLAQVKMLNGLLPICASCKKIRDDQGYWQQVEVYISEHSGAEFSHGICPDCMRKLYPEFITSTVSD